ncbi:MAG: DUF397 domain-containing protein [Nocardiopsaceae bacterium]|nr:DUF397 domain-containing protein [Nocardiopsaceae bacterium]
MSDHGLPLTWRKSSYSNESGGDCVEVAMNWHKSSYSNASGGHCVEVAETPRAVLVRDTQHQELGHLGFAPEAWTAFLAEVKARGG